MSLIFSSLSSHSSPSPIPLHIRRKLRNTKQKPIKETKNSLTMPTGNANGVSPSLKPKPSSSSGTNHACAACRYHRRKCAPDCVLAPYFPQERHRQFVNAHKLFGVSNITKIIKNLDPAEKDAAMHTIIFQSDARANDPVGGCYRIIRELQCQIEYTKAELDLVLHQLALLRARAHHQPHLQVPENEVADVGDLSDLCSYNNSNPYDYIQQENHQPYALGYQHLQEDIGTWEAQIEDPPVISPAMNMKPDFVDDHYGDDDVKPVIELPSERLEIKFEPDRFMERKINVA